MRKKNINYIGASFIVSILLSLLSISCEKQKDNDQFQQTDIGWFGMTFKNELKHPNGHIMFDVKSSPDFYIFQNGWVKVNFWKKDNVTLFLQDGKNFFFTANDNIKDVIIYEKIWKKYNLGWIQTKQLHNDYISLWKSERKCYVDSTLKVIDVKEDTTNQRFVLYVQGGDLKYLSFAGVIDDNSDVNVTSVKLDKNSATLNVGEKITLTPSVLPENASDKTVAWESNNTAIATVDNNGVVTALKAGNATITVKTKDGNKTASCVLTVNAGTVSVIGVNLNKASAVLTVGDTAHLTANVLPTNASDKTVSWSISDASIATVNNGIVTALKAGNATITVKTKDGNKTASCVLTVNAGTVSVTGVNLNKASAVLTVGDTAHLTANVLPSNASDKTVSWSTSDASIATVNNGIVTALKAGNATITVKTKDGNKTASCVLTVNAGTISVTGVNLNKTSAVLTVGDTAHLTANVLPTNASDKTVSWSTSDASIAIVDNNGVVTALKAGNATITVKTKDGNKTASCVLTINAAIIPVESVGLDKTSAVMEIAGTLTLTANVLPENASNKIVSWTTSNPTIATVNNGIVTAIKAGMATITVTTQSGSKTAVCAITVNAKVNDTVDFKQTDVGMFRKAKNGDLIHPLGHMMFNTITSHDFEIYQNGWVKVKLNDDGRGYYTLFEEDGIFFLFDRAEDKVVEINVLCYEGKTWCSYKYGGARFYFMLAFPPHIPQYGTMVIGDHEAVIDIIVDEPNRRFILKIYNNNPDEYLNW